MNKVIGKITTGQVSVLHGDHHIVTQGAIADGENISAGMILLKTNDGYKAWNGTDPGSSLAVALETLEGTAQNAILPIAVHGAVRTSKLCLKDGSAIQDTHVEALRKSGIHAIES